jgi:hypothetical protein
MIRVEYPATNTWVSGRPRSLPRQGRGGSRDEIRYAKPAKQETSRPQPTRNTTKSFVAYNGYMLFQRSAKKSDGWVP